MSVERASLCEQRDPGTHLPADVAALQTPETLCLLSGIRTAKAVCQQHREPRSCR